MLTFLIIIIGDLLFCLRMAPNHHLQRQHFRDVMMKKVEERTAQFTEGYHHDKDQPEEDAPEPYVWDRDYFRQFLVGDLLGGYSHL